MNIINERISVAGATTLSNVLAGNIFQLLKRPSRVRMGIVKVFGNADALTAKWTIGDTIIADSISIKTEESAGRGINVNSDLIFPGVGQVNASLGLAVTNPAVGAVVVEFYIIIEPIA